MAEVSGEALAFMMTSLGVVPVADWLRGSVLKADRIPRFRAPTSVVVSRAAWKCLLPFFLSSSPGNRLHRQGAQRGPGRINSDMGPLHAVMGRHGRLYAVLACEGIPAGRPAAKMPVGERPMQQSPKSDELRENEAAAGTHRRPGETRRRAASAPSGHAALISDLPALAGTDIHQHQLALARAARQVIKPNEVHYGPLRSAPTGPTGIPRGGAAAPRAARKPLPTVNKNAQPCTSLSARPFSVAQQLSASTTSTVSTISATPAFCKMNW